jgi:Tfp pilus assembly protein PilV
MDPLSMVILAIGSLACLQLAAMNLRGEERRPRDRRAARSRH